VIEVQDAGPGLNEKSIERVFERFYREDQSRSRVSGGVGLGLSIVAAVAEAHGGTVAARSEVGKGATFRIALPLLNGNNSHRTPSDFSDAVASMETTSIKGGT
jgi:two-component system OmpR family sensor kinase